jgi:hypothetical protein
MELRPEQAKAWTCEVRENLKRFRRKRKMTVEERLEFLSNQYSTLYQLNLAIDGKSRFLGVPQIGV